MMIAYPRAYENIYAMDVLLASIGEMINSWWQSLGFRSQNDLWLSIGWVVLVLWAWGSYRLLRRLAGHRRFGGRWYDRTEYERLMQVLLEDQQAGKRVLSHAELQALREFRYGKKMRPIVSSKGGGYFDV